MAARSTPQFKNRGGNVSRLEGFSDTAFGFAITLLVVSLTVPDRFDLLLQQLRGLPVFAVTFALISSIWYSQFIFFRRYGLDDFITIVLNLALLFVVLFFVYPLKFLFGVALQVNGISLGNDEVRQIFLIYGVGFAAVSLVLALLYIHAYRRRGELGLSTWELFVTRLSIADHLTAMAIGLLSAGLAQVVPGPYASSVAGLTYVSLAVPKTVLGSIRGRRARALATHEVAPGHAG